MTFINNGAETRMWPNTTPWLVARFDNTLPNVPNREKNAVDNWKQWEVPIVGWIYTVGGPRSVSVTPLIVEPTNGTTLVPADTCPGFDRIVDTIEDDDNATPPWALIGIRDLLKEIRDKM